MTTLAALKNLWWTTLIVLSFVGGLVLVRILYWPPDVGHGPHVPPGGFLKFLSILMFGYLTYCVWQFVLKPFAFVFVGSHRTPKPLACGLALVRYALPSAGIMVVPMAAAIAFELPNPFDIAPVALVFAAIWYVRRNASKAAEDIHNRCF